MNTFTHTLAQIPVYTKFLVYINAATPNCKHESISVTKTHDIPHINKHTDIRIK